MFGVLANRNKRFWAALKKPIALSVVGVRQGAPSSCLLFIIYINRMVQMIKGMVEKDGFLGLMYVLLLMGDTVVHATSREKSVEKLSLLLDYCHDCGMEIIVNKTKFFVVYGVERDKAPLTIVSHNIL